MAQYFEVKATYDKTLENGLVKRVTEPYLFDALSFTEAEGRAMEELKPYIGGEFSVKACKRTQIAEIFNIKADRYYLAKVAFISIDESKGVEKKTITQIIIGASSFEEAYELLKEGMKDTMADWELTSLAETAIVDVYPVETK